MNHDPTKHHNFRFPGPFFEANYANVAALTADALMNTSPWDYWVPDPSSNGSLQLRPAAGKAAIEWKQHVSVVRFLEAT